MRKPVIGITVSSYHVPGGTERAKVSLGYDYIQAVIRAGGVPILMAPTTDEHCILAQEAIVDGVIFSGGGDIYPPLYGQQPTDLIGFVDTLRDAYELKLLEFAVDKQKPILGLCRGAHVINIAFGGSLYQDMSLIPGKNLIHISPTASDALTHEVSVAPGSLLADITKDVTMCTNSSHHQVIQKVAPGFVVNARAADGLVEGIERKDDSCFIMGLQWHPERMAESEGMLEIFKKFIEYARFIKEKSTVI